RQKPPAQAEGSCVPGPKAQNTESALAELLAATCLVETNLLAFHFTCVTGDEAGLLQCGLERFVVVDECAGDAVAHCTCLTAFAATVNVDMKIKRLEVVGQFERLAHDHAASFTSKVFIHGLAVDHDLARALF